MLAICGDGDKLAPYIIFKGIKPSYQTLNLLNNNKYVKDKLILINFNQNAWSTSEIMLDWLQKIYLPYINNIILNKFFINPKQFYIYLLFYLRYYN